MATRCSPVKAAVVSLQPWFVGPKLTDAPWQIGPEWAIGFGIGSVGRSFFNGLTKGWLFALVAENRELAERCWREHTAFIEKVVRPMDLTGNAADEVISGDDE